jgi:hypothetical protein
MGIISAIIMFFFASYIWKFIDADSDPQEDFYY